MSKTSNQLLFIFAIKSKVMSKLTKQDLIDILNTKEKKVEPSILDVSFRILGVILLALVSWIASSTLSISKEIIELRSGYNYFIEKMEAVETTLKEPRFTRENFEESLIPIVNRVTLNSEMINTHDKQIGEVRIEVHEIEKKVQALELRKK